MIGFLSNLKYYGHDDVKLVNGPREKGIGEGRPDVPSYEATTFSAQPGDEAIRATRDEVLAALDDGKRLVDVRSPQEFSGELIAMTGYEQEGAQRAGHIPGAKSVPWAQAVTENGTFKSADELRELYTSKGVLAEEPIFALCRRRHRTNYADCVAMPMRGSARKQRRKSVALRSEPPPSRLWRRAGAIRPGVVDLL